MNETTTASVRLQVSSVLLLIWAAPLLAEEPTDKPEPAAWRPLFDGKSLEGWEVIHKGEFDSSGKVYWKEGALILEAGQPATGVKWKGKFPSTDFELALEAKRVAGDDFFCGLTFPVKQGSLSLVVGGWGGWVVGLSCIDGQYAIDNTTALGIPFERDQWYKFRVQVTDSKVRVWIDEEEIIDQDTAGHELAASDEMQPCLPVGLATWDTTGAIRKMRYRQLTP